MRTVTAKIKAAFDVRRSAKDRLNGITTARIYQKRGEWFLNDQPWDGGWSRL